MENLRTEKIEINEDKLKIAKQKLVNIATYKLIFVFISTVFTVLSSLYSDGFNILLLSTIIFVFPFFIESLEVSNMNDVEKFCIRIYQSFFIISTGILGIVLIWSFFDVDDALYYSKWFLSYIIYISITLAFIYSFYSYISARTNRNIHMALVIVEQNSLKLKNDMRNYDITIKEKHKEEHRNFIKEKSKKPNQGGK